MGQLTSIKLKTLEKEIALLRSAVVGLVGKDKEGPYRPEFVRRVFRSLGDKTYYLFKDATSFLSHLRNG